MLMLTTVMLILLCFFVFMVSRSNFDEAKYANAVRSIKQSFGSLPGGRSAMGAEEGLPEFGLDEEGRLTRPDLEMGRIRAVLAPALLDGRAGIIHTRNRRIISLSAGLAFNLDESALSEEMVETLTVFAQIMAENNVPIAVEGHTDNTPPQTEGVGDNWDVSSRRALAVLDFLTATGGLAPARLSAFAYAGTKPLHSNALPQGRAGNNRVDLALDFSEITAAELGNLAEKATSYNFQGFDFLLRDPQGGADE
ncbi:MAG: OmpA family protein [Candidatus Adiutrix sp.]|jgi:chemotaxis protein MotB|nr:OmpA family protein [Candidatus Adiutrix sp.]